MCWSSPRSTPHGCTDQCSEFVNGLINLLQNTAWLAYAAFKKSAEKDDPLRDKEVIISLSLISYFSVISFFAGLYYFISQDWPKAIHIAEPGADGRLSLVDSYYFSFVTAATVGYGDIYPVWTLPKLLVIAEIAISFCYVVLLFSAVVGFVRESDGRQP